MTILFVLRKSANLPLISSKGILTAPWTARFEIPFLSGHQQLDRPWRQVEAHPNQPEKFFSHYVSAQTQTYSPVFSR